MKVNLGFKFKDLLGEPIGKDLDLKSAASSALLGNYQDERIEGAEKVLRYKLAMKIFGAGEEVELTAEEIALIKKLIARMFSVLITGQAWEYLEK